MIAELILTVIALVAIGLLVWSKDSARKSYEQMVPRFHRDAAQHAANVSRRQQVVTFDGSAYHIHKADNQYAAIGDVVYTANPDSIEKSITVGDCISPKTNMIGAKNGAV